MVPIVEQHGFLEGEGDQQKTAREQRIARAKEKELMRSALCSTARYGCYVFDELITEEAGIIDFLVVGPQDVSAIVVRSDRGYVSLVKERDLLLIDGERFEDDPYDQGRFLVRDVNTKVFDQTYSVKYLICFLYAQLEIDENRQIPSGTTPLWELPWALDPEGEENLTADIEEIAEKVQKVYGRPPIVTPQKAGQEEGP